MTPAQVRDERASASSTLAISPAMPALAPVTAGAAVDAGAIWVGLVELETLAGLRGDGVITLEDAAGYGAARLLVRSNERLLGYVTLPIVGRGTTVSAVRRAVAALPEDAGDERKSTASAPEASEPEPLSVVICTRDRPDQLAAALASVLACVDGGFEVVVVDNAPATDATKRVVDELADPRVRYVLEPRAGLSTARNTGLAHARSGLVAFTDDDVLVDPLWLRWLRIGFASAPDVACVSGLVPSGELRNDIQRYFDARVSWSKTTRRREFRMSEPPADLPMFPFCVGEFGTGANFAVRRDVVNTLGGFDEALGVGTRTHGGEDLDIFVRILTSGHALVVEPSAFVWHRHRADLPALTRQAIGYGTGLGAWLTKVALDPRLCAAALRRSPAAVRRLVDKPMRSVDGDAPVDFGALDAEMRRVGRLELARVLAGPFALAAERWQRRARPTLVDVRAATAAHPWALLTAAASLAGLLVALPAVRGAVPPAVSLPLAIVFVALAPGGAVRAWVRMPRALTAVVVPGLGPTALILGASAMALAGAWHPHALTAGIAAVAIAAATVRLWVGARRSALSRRADAGRVAAGGDR